MSVLERERPNLLDVLPHPLIEVDGEGRIGFVNTAAQAFFQSSEASLLGRALGDFVPFGSPLLGLVEIVRQRNAPMSEYRVDLSSPRIGADGLSDLYVTPSGRGEGRVAVLVQQRGMAEKIDRQLTHRSAARSVTGLASMLAHEIKNPLAGIRGAAQLLETDADEDGRALTALITSECDRIVRLVDRMHAFGDDRPMERTALNIHSVLEQVRSAISHGFGRNVRLVEDYDPSLPPVHGNRDQLVQVFMNLAKNACEALAGRKNGTVTLRTAFRPGLRLSAPGGAAPVALPLAITVEDDGPGAPDEIAAQMFEPFVTTRASGTGLGLALVAKIVGDHGGIVEHERKSGATRFRVLLPLHELDEDA